jgi:SAM-dependent methyltransferase
VNFIENFHQRYALENRVRVLSDHLVDLIPPGARVLDVGCGDGLLTSLLQQRRTDLEVSGIDVLVRPESHIPLKRFDGRVIPYEDASFDVVMFVDVLHHTEDPLILLREAVRVARRAIVIKDHTCNGVLASLTLRFMDRVGNARHGVALPYNYWPRQKWMQAFDLLDLKIGVWKHRLKLYPQPASLLFDRSLHYLARLDISGQLTSPEPAIGIVEARGCESTL